MKDSELLGVAKKRIQDGKNRCICYALVDAEPNQREHLQLDALLEWIDKMLGEFAYYEDWYFRKFKTRISEIDAKKARLAWLDWMIAYCEKEEAEQAK